MSARPPLPIDADVPAILDAARSARGVVVVAPPGAGKTTRVPPALLALGPVALLQPRRVAARALARRIASERGWTLGEEVGWQIRFERRFTGRTRLLVMTEGVLTARLQSDPLLSDFAVVVIDEFHERSINADLALALARQAQLARADLRVVVMSATMDPDPVSAFLGGCPIVQVDARAHPVAIEHAHGLAPAAAVRSVLARGGGHVLCFLPGMGAIRRTQEDLAGVDAQVLPLHGSLDADAQDAALAPSPRRKVILATNIAETSLTVEGVTDVVDSGLARVLRFDPARGIDRLEIERIPQDSADQRAGRAGRTGPGHALRLWDPRDILRPAREPEIARIDLAAPLLDVLAWGGDPLDFAWFEAPSRDRVEAALDLLRLLGALEDRRLMPLGGMIHRLPLAPRLARVLVAAGGSPRAAAICALLAERDSFRGSTAPATTESDVLSRVDRLREAPAGIRELARELHVAARRELGATPARDDDEAILRALLAGYPDRVARRRGPGSPRLHLASGTGAILSRESGVREHEWMIAVEVVAGARGPGSEATVSVASAIERGWLEPTSRDVLHRFDEDAGVVRATARERYLELTLKEAATTPDPEAAAALLVPAIRRRGLGEAADRILRRLAFARLGFDVDAALAAACAGRTRVPDIDPAALVPHSLRRELARLAPETIEVPSGRRLRLEYRADGEVELPVKLQEIFGLDATPRVGPDMKPVLVVMLAPNGRPVQQTRDLRGFWERTYPEIRKELRSRYPRHPWPEDPWTARPTHRARPRGT